MNKKNASFAILLIVLFVGWQIIGLLDGSLKPVPDFLLISPAFVFLLFYVCGKVMHRTHAPIHWFDVLPLGLSSHDKGRTAITIALAGVRSTTFLTFALWCFAFVSQHEVSRIVCGVAVTLNILCLIPILPGDGMRITHVLSDSSFYFKLLMIVNLVVALSAFLFFGNCYMFWVVLFALVFYLVRLDKEDVTPILSREEVKQYAFQYFLLFWTSFAIDMYTSRSLLTYLLK
jgi:hypothetical protein